MYVCMYHYPLLQPLFSLSIYCIIVIDIINSTFMLEQSTPHTLSSFFDIIKTLMITFLY